MVIFFLKIINSKMKGIFSLPLFQTNVDISKIASVIFNKANEKRRWPWNVGLVASPSPINEFLPHDLLIFVAPGFLKSS